MTYQEPGEIFSVRRKDEAYMKSLKLDQNSYAAKVLSFMLAFEQFPRRLGAMVPKEDFELAGSLIREELQEFKIGFNCFESSQSFENMQEMVDGACDLIYVLLWAMLKFNIPIDACFNAVQFSNMSKLYPDGSYDKYPEGHEKAGKVKKPDHYVPADKLLREILMNHFDEALWDGNNSIRIGDKT